MTHTTKANTVLGAIIVVFMMLAVGYYVTGPSTETAQTPAPLTDQTRTGSVNP